MTRFGGFIRSIVTGRDLEKDQKVSHRICLLQYFVIIIDIIKLKNNKKYHWATFSTLFTGKLNGSIHL